MGWRRYINLAALIGVLLHAGMVVRHHQVMLGAHLERQELISSLGVICHGSGQASVPSDAELPWVPPPSDNQNSQCPLCAGTASAFAFVASVDRVAPGRLAIAAQQVPHYEVPPVEIAGVRPPTRGPPVLI